MTASRATSVLWLLVAVLAGCAQALSMAWPANGAVLPPLQVASLVVLLALRAATDSQRLRFALTWCFAIAWLAGSFWWLFISMHRFGGMPAAAAAAAVLLLAAFLGLYYPLALRLGEWVHARTPWPRLAAWLVFPLGWTCAELARDQWFTGFPWGAGGYAHTDGLLALVAPWVGVYGIGLLSALLAQWIWHVLAAQRAASSPVQRWVRALVALALLAMSAWSPHWPAEQNHLPEQTVRLVQGQVAQDEKFAAQRDSALHWYVQQLRASTSSLSVTPETALPYLQNQLPPDVWSSLRERFRSGDQAAIVGLIATTPTGYANSAIALMPAQEPQRYDKQHLVPFGEFTPPLFSWFARHLHIPLSDFSRGPSAAPSLQWQGQRLAIHICYEDLFGEELAQRFVMPGQAAPTALVNMSNIAWFGDTVAVDQHLHIARMRSLELQRPVLRATNTGATAIIDAQGRVTHRLPSTEKGVLDGVFQGVDGPPTLYAQWAGRWSLYPLWLLSLGGLVCLTRPWRWRTRP